MIGSTVAFAVVSSRRGFDRGFLSAFVVGCLRILPWFPLDFHHELSVALTVVFYRLLLWVVFRFCRGFLSAFIMSCLRL